MSLAANEVNALERATFDAVPPELTNKIGAWLLGLDHGTVGRAHSAVPMQHDQADVQALPLIEERYAAHGLPAVFRVPALPAFDPVRAWLLANGYAAAKPTRTFTGTVAAMAAVSDGAGVTLLPEPDAAWRAVFLGEGFDPVDGASRVQILARARHAVFACVRVGGDTVAAGMGSFSQGWASVHGMRTLAPHRGQGLARAILGALAREAQARGLEKTFLQVEAGNTGAQVLYQRAGFSPVWDYAYWSRV